MIFRTTDQDTVLGTLDAYMKAHGIGEDAATAVVLYACTLGLIVEPLSVQPGQERSEMLYEAGRQRCLRLPVGVAMIGGAWKLDVNDADGIDPVTVPPSLHPARKSVTLIGASYMHADGMRNVMRIDDKIVTDEQELKSPTLDFFWRGVMHGLVAHALRGGK